MRESRQTGSWTAEGSPIRIEYATTVLEEIRATSVDGFCRFRRGGIEVGGILFGKCDGEVVRILACRKVDSEYARGPSYVLSERDEARFREVMAAAELDPELSGLEPVGWYHSHTRSDLFLSEQDIDVHNRHFPEPWQVALVVRPEPFGSVRAAFFTRDGEGVMRGEPVEEEFVVAPQVTRAAAEPPPAPAPTPQIPVPPPPAGSAPPAWEAAQPPAGRHPVSAPARERRVVAGAPPQQRRRRSRGWLWAVPAAAILAALGAAAGLYFNGYWSGPAPQSLALKAYDADGRLQITWNPNARPVREAESGVIEIVDGGQAVTLPFDRERLRQGGVTYSRQSEVVEVRLKVFPTGKRPEQDYLRFVGSAPAGGSSTPEQAVGQNPPPAPVDVAPPVDAAQSLPANDQPPSVEPLKTETRKPAPRPFLLSQLPRTRAANGGPLPAPPQLAFSAEGPLARRAAMESGAPAVRLPGPPQPPKPTPVQAPKPAYTGPPSGRIIWTGFLDAGQAVAIEGGRASTGDITGALPGVPVRISAHPAELTSRGMAIYTAIPAQAQGAVEAPGPGNGWNRTAYQWDARRARGLLVLDAPSAGNAWKRVVVRNDLAPVSMIVIDWKVIPQDN
jgi:proteasome lid subunit RPN8/RPN11